MNSNISREDLFIINILNNIYNDNLRQIQSLQNSNNEIRRTISDLLYRNNRHTSRNNRQTNRNFNNSLFPLQNNSNQDLNLFTQLVNHSSNRGLNSFFDDSRFNPNLTNIIETFFEPITIYPTETQIENATRNVRFSDIVRPVNNSCPISLEPFQDNDIVTVIRHCGHIFNRNELNAWFRTNCRCPVCRYDIRDNTTNTTNTTNTSLTDISNNTSLTDSNNILNNNDSNNLADVTRRIVRQFLNTNSRTETNNLSSNETINDDDQNRSTEYSVFFTFPYNRH